MAGQLTTTTVASAGTTTLTAESAHVQVFTGTTTHTMLLPGAGVMAGDQYIVSNQSTGTITVQSSAAGFIGGTSPSRVNVYTARVDNPTAGADWVFTYLSGLTTATQNTAVMRDGSGNITTDAFISSRTAVATNGGTTTLTSDSTQVQVFTGTSAHTVKLPTTTIIAGQTYTVINQSTGAITVQSSGANTVSTLAAASAAAPVSLQFQALVDTPTTAAHWRAI